MCNKLLLQEAAGDRAFQERGEVWALLLAVPVGGRRLILQRY